MKQNYFMHKDQIKHDNYRHVKVSKHHKSCNGGKFRIVPIHQCKGQSRIKIEYMEKLIISLLKPELSN